MNLVVEAKRLSCGDPKRLRAHDHRTQERRDPSDSRASITGRSGLPEGQAYPAPDRSHGPLVPLPKPSRNSLTLAKKPADSGWVSLEDCFSNSANSSF